MTSWTRRQFLRVASQGAIAAALPSLVRADPENVVTISLLHTTDLHGHILPTSDYAGNQNLGGLARCATQMRAWRQANPHSILLDIGDVYQGTELGLDTRGVLMIRCLNALDYDAWVVGNHDFDWGTEALAACVRASTMPVLSGNALWQGQTLGQARGPLANIGRYLLKEIAGFRIAIVGLTTPALASWLPPENLRHFEALDPVESLRDILREIAPLSPDAIVLAGHMGLTRRDDEANRIGALTREFPQLTVCLGGHTHQNHSGEWINNVLYTQADHYGIYAGKVDLTFDAKTRRLLARQATTVLMDHQIAFDPLVLSLCRTELDLSDQILHREVGVLTEAFEAVSVSGQPSDQERLIGSGIRAALTKKGIQLDAVVHGLFDMKQTLAPGPKTVADIWNLLPYENEIVTIELSNAELMAVAQEFHSARESRPLMGMRIVSTRTPAGVVVTAILSSNGAPLPSRPSYRIALNSYDSQSGGGRFPILAQLVADPSHRRTLYPIQIRDALIDFFSTHQKISRSSLLI